ncbi:MAG: D-alanine--D-alanine ligase [Bacteroidetes bacterium]|nr:D-alanine--D-alanine ligase [Bacteroidota bacterium]
MIKVGIIFGGASREREISFAGGRTVFDNLNKAVFEAVPLFLDSVGNLILLDWQYVYKGTIRDFYPPVQVQTMQDNRFQLYAEHLPQDDVSWDEVISSVGEKVDWMDLPGLIDIAFLSLHGIQGEDGSIQGLMEMLKIPYTGSGILPSAIGMNKAFQKRILRSTSFDKTSFFSITRNQWESQDHGKLLERTLNDIGTPYVVRPANQGSSIGVSIMDDDHLATFEQAIDQAFFIQHLEKEVWVGLTDEGKYNWVQHLLDIKQSIGLPVRIGDTVIRQPERLIEFFDKQFKQDVPSLKLESIFEENEVVIESFIKGREFSCVVIENELGEPVALPPTEIIKQDEVYDYRSKYLAGLSRKVTPIDLPEAAIEQIRHECQSLYKLLKFDVYARIDGFYREDGSIVLNDPNTTSGMLPSSFFFHQAAEIGLNPSQFISYIIWTSLKARIRHGGDSGSMKALRTRLETQLANQQTAEANKTKVGVILGGYSSERHISVESGRNIYEKLSSSTAYDAIPIFLSKEGDDLQFHILPIHLLLKDNADDIFSKLKADVTHPVIQTIREASSGIISRFGHSNYHFFPEKVSLNQLGERVDEVFIALHGRPGEDGTLQRELKELDIPYNGSPPDSAAITIDKFRTKAILRSEGFVVAEDMLIRKEDWEQNERGVLEDLLEKVSFPFIAKPVDDGCSSAVKKIDDMETFRAFARAIFRQTESVGVDEIASLGLNHNEEFPIKPVILIEELISPNGANHFLEITGGMVTHKTKEGIEFEGFEPSESLATDGVLSLEEKFLAGQGQNITPARFDPDPARNQVISDKVRNDLVRAAKILGVEGYCRIDAFVRIFDESNVETIIIEVNSLPGMTPATCIFHQAAINGYQPIDFIDKILTFALSNKKQIETH